MTREQRIAHLVNAEGFTRSEAELIVDATVEAGFIAPNDPPTDELGETA